MKIRKARDKKYFAPQTEDTKRMCDHPGCQKKGEFRAPKDRNLKEYYWFCLDHVQEYNAKWNFYEGIGDKEPEENEARFSRMRFTNFGAKVKYSFGYDFFDEYEPDFAKKDGMFFTTEERRCLGVMEIGVESFDVETLKKQYKKLVKKYHPDVNQGDKEAEEKFKQVSVAYKTLLNRFN